MPMGPTNCGAPTSTGSESGRPGRAGNSWGVQVLPPSRVRWSPRVKNPTVHPSLALVKEIPPLTIDGAISSQCWPPSFVSYSKAASLAPPLSCTAAQPCWSSMNESQVTPVEPLKSGNTPRRSQWKPPSMDALTAPSLVTTHPVPANCALAEIHESPLSKPTVHVTPSSAVAMTELFSLIQPRPGASKWMSPTAPPASARRLSAGGSTPAMLDEVVDGNVVDGNVVVLVGVGVVDA